MDDLRVLLRLATGRNSQPVSSNFRQSDAAIDTARVGNELAMTVANAKKGASYILQWIR